MLREVSEKEFEEIARPALLKLCGSDNPNPFGNCFSSNVESRRILFEYLHIPDPDRNPKLLDTLHKIAKKHGDQGFYWSMRSDKKLPKNERVLPYHWYISFDAFDDFFEQGNWWFDNVIYSPNGVWGIVASDEHHSVIGGPNNFIDAMEQKVADLDRQVIGFLKHWKYYQEKWKSNVSWLPKFLDTIYDEEEVRQLLLENGFEDLVVK